MVNCKWLSSGSYFCGFGGSNRPVDGSIKANQANEKPDNCH